jgi:UDP:flavonoid glycosyltransferase YjiC (YdhE family)
MLIQVLTAGSYGSLRPYLALTRGLLERGHDARLLGPDHFASEAHRAGVPFEGLGPFGSEEEVKRCVAAMSAERDLKRHPLISLRLVSDSLRQLGERAIERTQSADLLVAHNFCLFGFVAAEVNRKPLATAHLFPCLIPSSQTWLSGRSYGRWINRLLWAVAQRVVARSTDAVCASAFEPFGLPRLRNVMLKAAHSRICNLVAVSPQVVARDPVWPEHYECTGYWTMAEPAYRPDPELQAFVEGGEPPVVITFGSMVGADAAAVTRLLLDAVARCGRRVVIQSGWLGLGQKDLPDHVRVAPFVPHDWLFARAACVVHHGGAGTTAATLIAGKPHIVVYHMGDQQFWCRHLQRRGLSAGGVWSHKLDAQWLARAIDRALHDPSTGLRAAALGRSLQEEDGIGRAARVLERVVARQRSSKILAVPAVLVPTLPGPALPVAEAPSSARLAGGDRAV